jgi:hypothetical protein
MGVGRFDPQVRRTDPPKKSYWAPWFSPRNISVRVRQTLGSGGSIPHSRRGAAASSSIPTTAGHRHLLDRHHPPPWCAPARTPSSTPRSRPDSLADSTSCLSKNLAAAVVEWFHLHPPSRFPLVVPPVAPPHGSRHPHCHSYPQVCNILTMVFMQSWPLFCNLLSISLLFLDVFSNKYLSRGPMLLLLLLVPC